MWKGCYGKEPFDLRLTVLRMVYRLPVIAVVTLAGTLAFGGGYYVKNILLCSEHLYAATSTYRVEYAIEEEKDVGSVYINEVSWNTYMQSQLFLDAVQAHLADQKEAAENGLEIGDQELAGALKAHLASDLRVPSITVTTESAEKSIRIAKAVEAAMVQEFAGGLREIVSVSVIDPGSTASEVIPDVRAGRAFGLSAVLSCFFAVIVLLLMETGDDSIWLPSTIWRRYGVKTVGTLKSRKLAENVDYLLSGATAICAAEEEIDSAEVLQSLVQACPEIAGRNWIAAGPPLGDQNVCEKLREADKILLIVQAGRHVGKRLERVLEHLEMQDCKVTAALLWGADERLIKWYYWKKSTDNEKWIGKDRTEE